MGNKMKFGNASGQDLTPDVLAAMQAKRESFAAHLKATGWETPWKWAPRDLSGDRAWFSEVYNLSPEEQVKRGNEVASRIEPMLVAGLPHRDNK